MVMRRRRAWADTRFPGTTIANNAERKDNLLLDLAATETKTVSRVLIDLWCSYSEANENESHNVVDVSVGVVSAEAFALGTFPDADATPEYPQQGWLYVATQPVMQALPTGAAVTAMWRMDAHFKADVRGQRKVDRGVLFMVISNVQVTNGTTITVTGRVRALCLT